MSRDTSQKSRNRPVRMNHRCWHDMIGLTVDKAPDKAGGFHYEEG